MRSRAALVLAAIMLSSCGTAPGGGARTPQADTERSREPTISPPAAERRTTSSEPARLAGDDVLARFRLHPAPWSDALDSLIGGAPMSVSVAIDGRLRFSHLGDVRRAPASNEKLLLSMALLDTFGPKARIATTVETTRRVRDGTVHGDVWLVGHGDPEVDDATVSRLADELIAAGVARVDGSIVGDTSTFRRERWAPGWHRIALSYASVPTALTFDGNTDASGFVFDPERRAAIALTADLRADGVRVSGTPDAGRAPPRTRPIASTRSAPLVEILRRQNASSINLDAEVLGKRLGEVESGRGSIAAGARALQRWARERGARLVAHDGSGLSYADAIRTDDMVRLLSLAEREPWGGALRSTLPSPGDGTLVGRLAGLRVRAKTGTLIQAVSALSGWLRARDGRPVAFSILSDGMSKDAAVALEDAVVRFLAARA